jgi:MOSC domain-containing protein YiiM
MGKIRSINLNQGANMPMINKNEIRVLEDIGFEGDRYSDPNNDRQIMIVEGSLYDKHELKQGSLRENLLIDGINLNNCKKGQRIVVNDNINMEITLVKDACASSKYNDPDLIKKLSGNMYVFATPKTSGMISQNDEIIILDDNE